MLRIARAVGSAAMAGLLAGLVSGPVSAQEHWPTKPVKLVVPFAAGGLSDTIARLVAVGLTEKFGQQFFIENRPGAGGAIGALGVARAEPDGYTLLVSGVGSHVTAPLTNAKIGYDPLKDFTHIAMLGGTADTLAVHPSIGVKTLDEFIKRANSTPGGMPYASSGVGTLAHMAFEYFRLKHHINVRPVPYAGGGGALTDAIAGHLPAIFSWIGGHAKTGELVAIAVSTAKRIDTVPNTPTFLELGYPELDMVPWFAISGPKNLPADITQKLNLAIRDVLKRPEIRQRMDAQSFVSMDWDVLTVQRYFASELARWTDAAKFVNANTKN